MKLDVWLLSFCCFWLIHCPRHAWGQQGFSPLSPPQITLSDQAGFDAGSSVADFNCLPSPAGPGPRGERTLFLGLDGSKQPQDFGANAHLGMQSHVAWSGPLLGGNGIGFQVGGGVTATANAVQVFELLGENSGRVQAFSTVGIFHRSPGGWAFGGVWDHQYQESFDNFSLNQFRLAASLDTGMRDQLGVQVILPGDTATAQFNNLAVELESIAQARFYWRRFWRTGTQTTAWAGIADGHSEQNVLAGPGVPKNDVFLFGADILAPLTSRLSIYGEANLMMPPDTGGVDAFLGLQFHGSGSPCSARRGRWSPLLPVASNTSFTVDLNR